MCIRLEFIQSPDGVDPSIGSPVADGLVVNDRDPHIGMRFDTEGED